MADFDYQEKMKKTLSVLEEQLETIRAGRANPRVLNRIKVDYYGTPSALNTVAAISTPDPRTIVIQPWDAGLIKEIEKAIRTSDLGINPQNDGKVIRLLFPQLTEERRKELIKLVRKYGEEAKIAIRNIRRDTNDNYKKQEKKSEITEDDLKQLEKDLQNETDERIKDVDKITGAKEKELLEV